MGNIRTTSASLFSTNLYYDSRFLQEVGLNACPHKTVVHLTEPDFQKLAETTTIIVVDSSRVAQTL